MIKLYYCGRKTSIHKICELHKKTRVHSNSKMDASVDGVGTDFPNPKKDAPTETFGEQRHIIIYKIHDYII